MRVTMLSWLALGAAGAVGGCKGALSEVPTPPDVDKEIPDDDASRDAPVMSPQEDAADAGVDASHDAPTMSPQDADASASSDSAALEAGGGHDAAAHDAGGYKDAPGLDADSSADVRAPEADAPIDAGGRAIFLPVAPTASRFAWQTLQTDFVDSLGAPCAGQVTIAVSDHAVCYENAAAQLMCAGSTYMTNYGPTFVPAGQSGVDQIMLSPTFNSATGNAICVHRDDGQVLCLGDANSHGEFGNGSTSPSATWVPWGSSGSFTHIATGTWDQICALDPTGAILCSGSGFGTSPVRQLPAMTATSMWVDTFGALHANDTTTFRASDGRTSGTVTPTGLFCLEFSPSLVPSPPLTIMGTAGTVVGGGPVSFFTGNPQTTPSRACWGDSSGHAWCEDFIGALGTSPSGPKSAFAGAGTILYVATNFYATAACVVSVDGSIWCLGDNTRGELGTGDTNPVTVATRVRPPGSVSVACK